MKTTLIIIGVAFLIGLGIIIGGKYDSSLITNLLTKEIKTYVRDSVTIEKHFYNEIAGKPIRYTDTLPVPIYLDSSFVAEMDTTATYFAGTDSAITISENVQYFFPQNQFKRDLNLEWTKYKDTVFINKQINIPFPKTDWTITAVGTGAGYITGIATAIIIKNLIK